MSAREELIENQLKKRGINDEQVLQAMREIGREDFVPEKVKKYAYEDRPLPIGKGQTISQPFIVAYMAEALHLQPTDTVLEIGTGCGYNAAILSRLVKRVYSIEVIDWLAEYAKENLAKSGVSNVTTSRGDGFIGWPEKAPFDAIILTAAPPAIPGPLKAQLKIGGKLIAPTGIKSMKLVLLNKTDQELFHERNLLMVSFVPMTGKAQKIK